MKLNMGLITNEIKTEIKKEINKAYEGNGYGDGFIFVPTHGKFLIKYNKSEEEFDFILDALKFYNSIKKDKAFWDLSNTPELIDCQ